MNPVTEQTFQKHADEDLRRFNAIDTKLDEQTLILKQINAKVVPLDEDRAFKERLGKLAFKAGSIIVGTVTLFELIWHFFVPPKM